MKYPLAPGEGNKPVPKASFPFIWTDGPLQRILSEEDWVRLLPKAPFFLKKKPSVPVETTNRYQRSFLLIAP
jgi:hypothetical protein